MKLQNLKVIDLSLFLPGPHLTLTMADHGAEVIKIEPPGGEPVRAIGEHSGGHSVYFRNTHRGKQSVQLNLKGDAGRAAFAKLADTADVIVEAFRPGVAERLGIGYEAVAARNPRIVYVSIAAFGQSGPERDRPAHDLAVEALTGAADLNRDADGAPVMPHMPVADMAASMMALSGILMALLRRAETGQGDYLDLAMYDATLSWLPHITDSLFAGDRLPQADRHRLLGGHAFYAIYPTKDQHHVVLGGSESKFVKNLLTALERPDLIAAANGPPGPGHEPVKTFLRATFATKTRDQWDTWLSDQDVCSAPLLNLREAFARPQVAAREMLVKDDDGNPHIGIPMKFRNEPGRIDPALAQRGEHTEQALRAAACDEELIAAVLRENSATAT